MSNLLPVHERFTTFQGEGVNMGRAAFFIRTFGCPLHCGFCDSAGTWHPDYIPARVDKFSVDQLVSEAGLSNCELVVITGGEPAIHDLLPLTAALQNNGHRIAIETSGSFPIRGKFDCITVSPKRAKAPLPESLAQATELKLIITEPDDIGYWLNAVGPLANMVNCSSVWLHPEWSQRNNPAVLNAITQAVIRLGDPIRAGYQLHKLYRADLLDPRTAPTAPLGGNPATPAFV